MVGSGNIILLRVGKLNFTAQYICTSYNAYIVLGNNIIQMCLQTVNRFLAQSFHVGCVKHIKITGGCGFLHFIISLFFSRKHAAVIGLGLANLPLQFAARKNRQAGSNGVAVAVSNTFIVNGNRSAILINCIITVICITATSTAVA